MLQWGMPRTKNPFPHTRNSGVFVGVYLDIPQAKAMDRARKRTKVTKSIWIREAVAEKLVREAK